VWGDILRSFFRNVVFVPLDEVFDHRPRAGERLRRGFHQPVHRGVDYLVELAMQRREVGRFLAPFLVRIDAFTAKRHVDRDIPRPSRPMSLDQAKIGSRLCMVSSGKARALARTVALGIVDTPKIVALSP
jgi:hypothetical protein